MRGRYYRWPGSLDQSGYNQATAIAVDGSGNVLVTGYSPSQNYYDYTTIKYSSSLQPGLAIQRIGDRLVLSWTNAAFRLQCAPAVSGAFIIIPDATSPYTNFINASQQYFRLTAP